MRNPAASSSQTKRAGWRVPETLSPKPVKAQKKAQAEDKLNFQTATAKSGDPTKLDDSAYHSFRFAMFTAHIPAPGLIRSRGFVQIMDRLAEPVSRVDRDGKNRTRKKPRWLSSSKANASFKGWFREENNLEKTFG